MTPHLTISLTALLMLSLTGCVAAVPMATQLMSNTNAASNLCSFAKVPGQSGSLCDRFASAMQTQGKSGTTTAAAR